MAKPNPYFCIDDVVLLRVAEDLYATVDAADYPLVAKRRWRAEPGLAKSGKLFYAVAGSERTRMHALIAGCRVDHINGNGLDNRRSNLRPCTQQQNTYNRAKHARPCTSKYRGVRLNRGRWYAEIQADGKRKYIGSFTSEDAAARAWDAKARELYGEFARLNFPDNTAA